jgi:pseudouridine synthase
MAESLQKIVASSGICSRRKAEQLILEGKVKVDNKVIYEPGFKVAPEHQTITVNGKIIKPQSDKFYFAFYKPRECLSTMSDVTDRKTIKDYLPRKLKNTKIIVAGRLDYNATGLVILTNDGKFANYITHPRFGVKRTYRIKLNKNIDSREIEKISKKLLNVRIQNNNWISVVVPCGHEHKIPMLLLKIGALPDKVCRIGIGNIFLGNLRPGEIKAIPKPTME